MATTPTTPKGLSQQEALYRGVAMSQLRILKQQMQLGKLNLASRKVTLDNGVEIYCNICFNKEDVWVELPPVPTPTQVQLPDVNTECLRFYGLPLATGSGTLGGWPEDTADYTDYIGGTYHDDGYYAEPIARITDESVTIGEDTKTWIEWLIEYAPGKTITLDNGYPTIGDEPTLYVAAMMSFISSTGYVCSKDNVVRIDAVAEGSLQIYQLGMNASLSNDLYTLIKSSETDSSGYHYWCVYNMPVYREYSNWVPGYVPPPDVPDVVVEPPPVIPPQVNTDRILRLVWDGALSEIYYDSSTTPSIVKTNTPYVVVKVDVYNIIMSPYAWDTNENGYATVLYYEIKDFTKAYLLSAWHIEITEDVLLVPSVTVAIRTLESGRYQFYSINSFTTYSESTVSVPVGSTDFHY